MYGGDIFAVSPFSLPADCGRIQPVNTCSPLIPVDKVLPERIRWAGRTFAMAVLDLTQPERFRQAIHESHDDSVFLR